MMKRLGLLLIFAVSFAFSAEGDYTQTFYRDYKLNFDKSDNLVDKVEPSAFKEGEFYFMVKSKDNRIFSIGYYDNKGNINSYLLDRFYNIRFHYVTFEYKNEGVSVKNFKDADDFVLGKIEFEYNAEKKVSKTTLWLYSLARRELLKTEETSYLYKEKGEKYETIERLNSRNQIFEKIHYRGTEQVQEYERYDIDGKTLQYRIKMTYEAERVKKEYFSKSDVLIKTVYEKIEKTQKQN